MKTLPLNQSREENKAFGELSSCSELRKLISEATVHKEKVSFKNILLTVLNYYTSFPLPIYKISKHKSRISTFY